MTPDRLGCRDPSLRLRAPLRVTTPERMGDRSHLDAHASAAQRQHENRFSVLGSRFYSHIGQPILTGRYWYMTTTEVQAQQRRRHAAIATLQASAPPLALTRGDWMRSLLVFVPAVLALLLADVALLWLHPGEYYVPVGNYRDKLFLQRVNYQETASDGTTYRWTTADSTLWLNQIGVARRAWLRLDLGGRP